MLKKRTITFEGGDTLVIAELNTAQIADFSAATQTLRENTTPADDSRWESNKWVVISRSLNNVKNPPDESNALGSIEGLERYKATIGFQTSFELHQAILDLSGLRPEKVGEKPAVA